MVDMANDMADRPIRGGVTDSHAHEVSEPFVLERAGLSELVSPNYQLRPKQTKAKPSGRSLLSQAQIRSIPGYSLIMRNRRSASKTLETDCGL
ncbi:hypothetical protein VB005_01097 [Metarhizium brunneum]